MFGSQEEPGSQQDPGGARRSQEDFPLFFPISPLEEPGGLFSSVFFLFPLGFRWSDGARFVYRLSQNVQSFVSLWVPEAKNNMPSNRVLKSCMATGVKLVWEHGFSGPPPCKTYRLSAKAPKKYNLKENGKSHKCVLGNLGLPVA